MWIIINGLGYIERVNENVVFVSSDRDNAKRFSSKQEAKDFMAKYSITGSIIPA